MGRARDIVSLRLVVPLVFCDRSRIVGWLDDGDSTSGCILYSLYVKKGPTKEGEFYQFKLTSSKARVVPSVKTAGRNIIPGLEIRILLLLLRIIIAVLLRLSEVSMQVLPLRDLQCIVPIMEFDYGMLDTRFGNKVIEVVTYIAIWRRLEMEVDSLKHWLGDNNITTKGRTELRNIVSEWLIVPKVAGFSRGTWLISTAFKINAPVGKSRCQSYDTHSSWIVANIDYLPVLLSFVKEIVIHSINLEKIYPQDDVLGEKGEIQKRLSILYRIVAINLVLIISSQDTDPYVRIGALTDPVPTRKHGRWATKGRLGQEMSRTRGDIKLRLSNPGSRLTKQKGTKAHD